MVLNIHDLVKVRLKEPPEWLARGIGNLLGDFVVDTGAGTGADVRLLPVPDGPGPDLLWTFSGARHRLACAVCDGRRGVMILHHERADVGVFPGECIDLLYNGRRRALRRVYGLLLLAVHSALRRKGGLLVHGACLAGREGTVLITGPRSSGKTLLGLTLLRDGWDYLADDKLVLARGCARPLESTIRLRDHHVRRLPWLAERLPAAARRRQSATRRAARRLMGALGAALPGKLLGRRWRDKWNWVSVVGVGGLFPAARLLQAERPDFFVHLRPSDRVGCRSLSEAEMVARIAAVQRMLFCDVAPLEELLTSFCGFGMPSEEDVVAENIRGPLHLEFDMPMTGDLEEVKGAFERCLQQH